MKTTRAWPALLLLLALPAWAAAQTVWRCGPEGRSFSDTPCADGQALALADARPSQDLAAARALANRELRLAEKLRRERLREEAAQRGNGLAALGPSSAEAGGGLKPPRQGLRQEPRAQAKPPRPAPAADETFRAVGPASRRVKG
jgi:hypothetical protein